MTIGEISTKITNLTGQDTTNYSNTDRLIDINIWLHKVGSIIRDSQDESDFDDLNFTDYPNLTSPLVAGQRDYVIPVSEHMISIKNVSISYDGSVFNRATPIDASELDIGLAPASNTTANNTIDGYFSKVNPRYDTAYNSVFIYPRAVAADVTAGGKIFIEWQRDLDPFTSSELTTGTKVPGFDTTYHPILAYGPSYDFLFSHKVYDKADRILPILTDWEVRLRREYATKNRDRVYQLKNASVNFK